jgi:hypothetical protein
MPFDAKRFLQTAFQPRTAGVDVPGLADWFGEGERPVWTVRGQTANEVANANDASAKHKNIDAVIKAISSNADQIAELKKAIGVTTDTPAEIVKRLEQLVQCSVEPTITLDIAVKLAEVRPVEFYILTNKIVELTGLGMDVKKPKASGKAAKSED